MGYFLFTIGFLGLTVFGIWLIINLIIKKPIKKIGIALIASFLAFCIGIAIVPVDSDAGSAPREQNEDVLPGEDEVGDIENPIQEDQDGSQPSKSEKKEEDIPHLQLLLQVSSKCTLLMLAKEMQYLSKRQSKTSLLTGAQEQLAQQSSTI